MSSPELRVNPGEAAPRRAGEDWPPVVVGSVFQTGLNLMRDLLSKGVRVHGVDYAPEHEGFRSVYGQSHLCPNPDTDPRGWVEFMRALSGRLGARPVLIPAADIFVSALGRHADELRDHYVFSPEAVSVQARLATKEKQYALAREHGFPTPLTAYVTSEADLERFCAAARFPCLLKPRHQREWEALPVGNPLRGLKVTVTGSAAEMLGRYRLAASHRPEVVAQEVVEGPDDSKYCYLSVYAGDSSRLGYCVVREHRVHPPFFGSASVVSPVVDEEIAQTCDSFLRRLGYVGLCEIEVKRDARDGAMRLIEVNPRFSVTGDCAKYAGVEVGWLHYLALIGRRPAPVEPSRFGFHHVTLRRDLPVLPYCLAQGLVSWRDVARSYRPPVAFFDFDLRDWRVTASTMRHALRSCLGASLRALGLRKGGRAPE